MSALPSLVLSPKVDAAPVLMPPPPPVKRENEEQGSPAGGAVDAGNHKSRTKAENFERVFAVEDLGGEPEQGFGIQTECASTKGCSDWNVTDSIQDVLPSWVFLSPGSSWQMLACCDRQQQLVNYCRRHAGKIPAHVIRFRHRNSRPLMSRLSLFLSLNFENVYVQQYTELVLKILSRQSSLVKCQLVLEVLLADLLLHERPFQLQNFVAASETACALSSSHG
ncbi:hypothetical protein GUJ93_ZPchr0005g16056 [Zizania palustris]|uniref:Uncharacterized protein n=1 Tax=Zizania palustris TaxID=103762 RepID=A0A8J5SVM7_ZIZPA|nr:hypothetical protein GUJ93_ZPchr0005g16056 [Zizania palustris]